MSGFISESLCAVVCGREGGRKGGEGGEGGREGGGERERVSLPQNAKGLFQQCEGEGASISREGLAELLSVTQVDVNGENPTHQLFRVEIVL